MKFTIEGKERSFIPLKQFRETHHLPESFGVPYFEPKDFTGLAAIDRAGQELNHLKKTILNTIPVQLNYHSLMPFYDHLQRRFEELMYQINHAVGLKPEEVEFAVSGFGDMNQIFAYALIHAYHTHQAAPDFKTLYQGWVSDSIRVNTENHAYSHEGQLWQIRVISHIYGRIGLQVQTASGTDYVQDTRLACPAEGYMLNLLEEVSQKVIQALSV